MSKEKELESIKLITVQVPHGEQSKKIKQIARRNRVSARFVISRLLESASEHFDDLAIRKKAKIVTSHRQRHLDIVEVRVDRGTKKRLDRMAMKHNKPKTRTYSDLLGDALSRGECDPEWVDNLVQNLEPPYPWPNESGDE